MRPKELLDKAAKMMNDATQVVRQTNDQIEAASNEIDRLRAALDAERAKVAGLVAVAEKASAMPCLRDTDGDDGCGRRFCPWCGTGGHRDKLQAVARVAKEGVVKQ